MTIVVICHMLFVTIRYGKRQVNTIYVYVTCNCTSNKFTIQLSYVNCAKSSQQRFSVCKTRIKLDIIGIHGVPMCVGGRGGGGGKIQYWMSEVYLYI